MYRKTTLSFLSLVYLIAALALSGCTSIIEPVSTAGTAPTPVVVVDQGGVDAPENDADEDGAVVGASEPADPAAFTSALLGALAAGDRDALAQSMSDPFFSGAWRGGQGEQPAVAALDALFPAELGEGRTLEPIAGADLPALLGGADPLAIPGGDAPVEQAVLVRGWGIDGLDDAVLFLARQPDNSLRWRGWMRVNGGFRGERFGGTQPYQSEALGFRFDVPNGFTVSENPDGSVSVTAPAAPGAGHPGGASIVMTPAGPQRAEQAARQVYQESRDALGPGAEVMIQTLDFDGEPAYLVSGVPSQNMQREMFIDHGGRQYHFWFYPDEPDSSPLSYMQMQALYDLLINTFHFTS